MENFTKFLGRNSSGWMKVLLVVMGMVCTMNVFSRTATWDGGAGTLVWSTATNWDTDVAPVAGDDIIFNTAGTFTITSVPTLAINSLTISNGVVTLSGATVTLTIGGKTGSDLVVSSSKGLTLNGVSITLASSATADISGTFTITTGTFDTNGTSVVTTVSTTGSISNAGTLTCTTATNLVFEGSSSYTHNQNGGTIPTADWNGATGTGTSTCTVTGMQGTAPTGMTQSFHHVIWNCTGQTANFALNIDATVSWAGNFTLTSTGSTPKYFCLNNNSSGTTVLSIGGNANIQGGILVVTAAATGSGELTITGNLTLTSTGILYGHLNNNGHTINVNGDVSTASGTTFKGCSGWVTNGNGTWNFAGNVDLSLGTVYAYGSSGTTDLKVAINLTGTNKTLKLPSNGGIGAQSNNFPINWNINISSGASITLGSDIYIGGFVNSGIARNRGLTVTGTLDMGMYVVYGAATYSFTTVNAGSTLKTANTGGIVTAGTASGAVQTATRTFNAGANYVYNGTSAQVTGTGLPTPITGSLTIDNTAGVTLTQATTVSTGTVVLTNGYLTTTSTNLLTINNTATSAISSPNSAYISGPLKWTIANTSATYQYPVGKSGSGYYPFTINSYSSATSQSPTVEVFVSDPSGTYASGCASNSEYWKVDYTANALSNPVIKLQRATLSTNALVGGKSNSANGAYTSYGGTVAGSGPYTVTASSADATSFGTALTRYYTMLWVSSVGGTATAASSSISTGNSTSISVSGYTGTIQWQQSSDNSTFSNVSGGSGANSATYTTPNLSSTTYYRAVISNGPCSSANSSTATVTIVIPTITTSGTLSAFTSCSGTNSTSQSFNVSGSNMSAGITITPPAGYEVSTSSTFASNIGTNSSPIIVGSSGTISSTPIYVRTTTSAINGASGNIACTSTSATTKNVATGIATIDAVSVGGTIAGSATVCTGTNSTGLTLSGHTGTITRWESSLDNFATAGTTIVNTTTTQTATNLSATTYYRAVITSGSCASANSAVATVTVSPASVGGSIAGSATVCTGTNSTGLTLSGHTGTITRWESSLDNFATAGTTIANTTTTQTATNLSATTYYRAVITSGSCASANSASALIIVRPTFSSGAINTTGETICSGGTPTQIGSATAASGGDASITYSWRSSTDAYAAAISGATSATYTPPAGLTTTTSYRRYANDGSCNTSPSVATGTWTVSVTANVTPSVSVSASSTSVCAGSSVTFTATPNNGGGSPSYQWKLNGNTVGTNATTYVNSGLSSGDVVTVVMTANNTCQTTSTVNSTNDITMSNANVTPTISISANNNTSCAGSTVTFSSSSSNGGAGPTYQWKLNGSIIPGATGSTYNASSFADQDKITVVMTSNASCITTSTATSNEVTLTRNVLPTVTSTVVESSGTSNDGSVCSGTSVTLVGAGASTYSWDNSITNNVAFTASTTTTYTVTGTDANGCVNTATRTVTVNALPSAPTSITPSSGVQICNGVSTNLNATSAGNTIYWYTVSSAGSDIGTSSSAANFSVSPTSNTTYYAEAVSSSGCVSASRTATATVTVNARPSTAVLAGSTTICNGSSANLTVTVSGGASPYSVVYSGGTVNSYTSASNISVSPTTNTTYTLTSVTDANGCTAISPSGSATVSVDAASVLGTAGSSQSITSGSTAALSLSGNTGSIQWQESADGATGWTNVSGGSGATSSAYTTATLTSTNYYRVVVTNGVCPSATSSAFTITVTSANATITLAANTISSASPCASTTKVPIQSFSLAVTNGSGNLTNVGFTTIGTYAQTDVSIYQLWYHTSNDLSGASKLGTDLSSSGAAGSRTFSAFSSPTLSSGSTYYFWITADIASGVTNNNTLAVNAITTSNLTTTSNTAGTTAAGGTQTLKALPTTADAGANQTSAVICGISEVTLAGNNPTIGSGTWTIQSGTNGSLTSASTYNSTFNGKLGQTYVLRWTISNATCASSFDDVSISFIPPKNTTPATGDYVWKGNTNTWATAGNWLYYDGTKYTPAGSTPTSSNHVIIAAKNNCASTNPTLTADISVGSLVIEAGATFNQSSYTTTISGDFTNDGTFNAGTGTTIFTGAATITGATTFHNLTVNGATTFASSHVVNNTLDLGNKITLGANNLTIGSLGVINGYNKNNFIITNGAGKLIQKDLGPGTSKIFPLGISINSYTPITLEMQLGAITDDFSVRVAANRLANGTSGGASIMHAVDRTWFVEEGTPNGSDVKMTIQWNASEELMPTGNAFNRLNCFISHYKNNTWESTTAGQAEPGTEANSYKISRSGITSFSPFAVEDPQALPITLIDFTAKAEGKKVRLDWETGTEENNDYFTIERSLDGKNFEKVFTKKGAGNSKVNLYYFGYDASPYTGISYYRLKQTDFDGKFAYSDIVSVKVAGEEVASSIDVKVYPNPITNELVHVDLKAQHSGMYTMRIINEIGQQIFTETYDAVVGDNTYTIGLPNVVAGVYILEIRNQEDVLIDHVKVSITGN